jgi:D-alanyl-D-alanine carboxypeptidase (penicillin-binding protein 5/6)
MLTAIVAIENLPDLKEEIKLTNSMFEGLFEADASMAGFQPGEKVRGSTLYTGCCFQCGAESCIALADKIAAQSKTL